MQNCIFFRQIENAHNELKQTGTTSALGVIDPEKKGGNKDFLGDIECGMYSYFIPFDASSV